VERPVAEGAGERGNSVDVSRRSLEENGGVLEENGGESRSFLRELRRRSRRSLERNTSVHFAHIRVPVDRLH